MLNVSNYNECCAAVCYEARSNFDSASNRILIVSNGLFALDVVLFSQNTQTHTASVSDFDGMFLAAFMMCVRWLVSPLAD